MSSRGTNAGIAFTKQYKTVGTLYDAKILVGIDSRYHGLPEVSRSPNAKYIKLSNDGELRMMRIYDDERYLTLEIGYHPEASINNGNRKDKVLHYHTYNKDFNRSKAVKLTENNDIYKKYKKYLEALIKQ